MDEHASDLTSIGCTWGVKNCTKQLNVIYIVLDKQFTAEQNIEQFLNLEAKYLNHYPAYSHTELQTNQIKELSICLLPPKAVSSHGKKTNIESVSIQS
jgi:hypothetical protein